LAASTKADELLGRIIDRTIHLDQQGRLSVNGETKDLYRYIDCSEIAERTFLQHHRPSGPQLGVSWTEVKAFLKSLWLLGVRDHERFTYWRFFITTLVRQPRQFYRAMELSILGYHFRRVASGL